MRVPARIEVGGTRNGVVLARIEMGTGQLFRALNTACTPLFSASVEKSVDKMGKTCVFCIDGDNNGGKWAHYVNFFHHRACFARAEMRGFCRNLTCFRAKTQFSSCPVSSSSVSQATASVRDSRFTGIHSCRYVLCSGIGKRTTGTDQPSLRLRFAQNDTKRAARKPAEQAPLPFRRAILCVSPIRCTRRGSM